MLSINGVIQLVPGQVAHDSGTIKPTPESEPEAAVVQTLITASGPVQVVYPATAIPGIIDGLKQTAERAEVDVKKPADLYIPHSAQEVEQVAEAHQKITEGKIEVGEPGQK